MRVGKVDVAYSKLSRWSTTERSWGGPGRRFITNSMLKAYHAFLRDGAYALVDSEQLDDADVSPPPPIVITQPRAAVVRHSLSLSVFPVFHLMVLRQHLSPF